MLKSIDKVRKDLHHIIEDLALNQIKSDPLGFMKREAKYQKN